METNQVTLKPIATVVSERVGISDDDWGDIISTIRLDSTQFEESALDGIEGFSHIEVISYLHLVDPKKIPSGARHPRNLEHLPKIGILSQRPKARPNQIGLSCCKILGRDQLSLKVQGLDLVNGTPILDIKPYYHDFGPREETFEPSWVQEILKNYY